MGAMKRFAENVSDEMGFGGFINEEVMLEAQRRLEQIETEQSDDES